ncbi:hypothetical protein ADUPG1_013044 [Aduncisulcus paluster]|uniref:Uncharacterized protein n=1 Tax=Aduncisulcus paluster TaxID=2918883 RepID=A0ABQ5K1L2_9EUKA|nr:hypothetical protein ADUPG1_013044 [Aduncisulcus paluster]
MRISICALIVFLSIISYCFTEVSSISHAVHVFDSEGILSIKDKESIGELNTQAVLAHIALESTARSSPYYSLFGKIVRNSISPSPALFVICDNEENLGKLHSLLNSSPVLSFSINTENVIMPRTLSNEIVVESFSNLTEKQLSNYKGVVIGISTHRYDPNLVLFQSPTSVSKLTADISETSSLIQTQLTIWVVCIVTAVIILGVYYTARDDDKDPELYSMDSGADDLQSVSGEPWETDISL